MPCDQVVERFAWSAGFANSSQGQHTTKVVTTVAGLALARPDSSFLAPYF
jgi:hypothetical protein